MRTRSSSRRANEKRAYTNAFWAGPHIVLLSRDEQGELVRELVPAEHTSFIRRDAFEKHPDLRGVLEQSRFVVGWRHEGAFVRISWTTREKSIQAAAKDGFFAQYGIEVFEADVDPVRRWVTDNPIDIAKPRRCYLDLETDDRVSFAELPKMKVLCWSVVAHDADPVTGEYATFTGVLEVETLQSERELLRALFEVLRGFDQVAAWNGDRFDFKVIGHRLQAVGLAVEMRRWLWVDQMLVFERFDKASAESGEEKQSLSLAAVAASKLGADEKKLVELGKVGGERTYAMWAAGGAKRDRLVEYCLDDAQKQRKIEEKTGYLDLLFTVGEVTHSFPDTRGADPVRFVEGYLLRMGAAQDYRFPTWYPPEVNEDGEREKFRGAWVQEPTKTGILHDVHVADFAGMYPAIIITWNMSLDTMRPNIRLVESAAGRPTYLAHLPLKRWPIPEGHCAAPDTEVVFANEPQGILPAAVSEIIRLRAFWNDEKKKHAPGSPAWHDANRRSAAFKICANSFYGVMGSVWSRFFDKRLAESVTQAGVWLIQETSKAGERRGISTIYGDTDSTFSMGVTETEFGQFVEFANTELYPRLLKERGCTRNRISLAYEKAFSVLVLLGKKRYAGRYAHYKGKRADATSKPEIKGLEYKRGDATRLARSLQSDVIDMLLAGMLDVEQYNALVMRYRTRILEDAFELSDIVQSKGLSKSLREYVSKKKADGTNSALPAHVVVAHELRKRGRDVGQGIRVEYFVKDASTEPVTYAPAEDWTGEFDRYHTWEKQVYPPTERVLACAFPGNDWHRFERARPAKESIKGGANLFGAGTLAVPVGGASKRAVKKPTGAKVAPIPTGQKTLF
jgi:DNA polymerase elongation subunit (family B)